MKFEEDDKLSFIFVHPAVGDLSLDIPCPADLKEKVNMFVFRWFSELNSWASVATWSDVSCNGTAQPMRRLSDGHYSYAVVGAETKTVHRNFTDPPPGIS